MTSSTDGSTKQLSEAVVDAMRALLWLKTSADARRATEKLVRQLGGTIVSPNAHDAGDLPADITFGDGEPLVALRRSAARRVPISRRTWLRSCSTPGGHCN